MKYCQDVWTYSGLLEWKPPLPTLGTHTSRIKAITAFAYRELGLRSRAPLEKGRKGMSWAIVQRLMGAI